MRGAGEDVFHPGEVLGCGDVPDAVQGGGDDGPGAGGDGPLGEGGGGFLADRGLGVSGEAGAGEDGGGQGEPAAGFSGADPQPDPQELRGVPAPVIGRRHPRDAAGAGGGAGRGSGSGDGVWRSGLGPGAGGA